MRDTIRDSTFGQIARLLFKDKLFKYREEQPGFEYLQYNIGTSNHVKSSGNEDVEGLPAISNNTPSTLSTDSGDTILIGWYGDNDPENPQNWSELKRYFVGLLICLYTFSVYVGSSIYAPAEAGVMEEFGVGQTVSSLGLALYVLGYGLGPLLFSPLSEISYIGRTPPYIITCALFVILLVPTALAKNLAGLMVLRFLLGFFGSPSLGSAGGTFSDIFPGQKMPYIIAIWAAVATCGPSFGPLISAYSVEAKGWRWSQWELIWLAGPVLIIMFVFLPETSSDTILLRRAARLRKSTGNDRILSQSEKDHETLSPHKVLFNALIKPWQINVLDPAILFTTLYTGLLYSIIYTFFESFPLIYIDVYHFSPGSNALAFLSIFISLFFLAVPTYVLYFRYRVESRIKKHGMGPPEDFLKIGLYPCFCTPIGLFIFGWTGREGIHWMVTFIGMGIANVGLYYTMQCLFIYLPFSHPKYAASLLAANGLSRSVMGTAGVLYAPPLFEALGVGGGISLLAGLTLLCCGGLWFLYIFGARLRARSRFSVK